MSPRLSVIIPTYNRAEVLDATLDALAAQTVDPLSFEVVVCDDGSSDTTQAVLARHAASGRLNLKALRQRNAGANAARNRAIEAASGTLLLILNDDTIAVPGLIERHLAVHDRLPTETTAVLGRMTIDPSVPFSAYAAFHHDASFAGLKAGAELPWTYFFTCNVSVHRSLVIAAGGFADVLRWHEDVELGRRLAALGLKLIYEPEALGLHRHFLTRDDYYEIARREGRSLVVWLRRQPEAAADLARLGLVGLREFPPALRHRVADALLPRVTIPFWVLAADQLSRLSPALARPLQTRLFQRIKRVAIRDTVKLVSAPLEKPR